MRLHAPIITGSVTTNLNGGSFVINNGPFTQLTISSGGNLFATGSITTPSNISASTYYGDGSNLSGIGSVPFPYTGSATVSGSMIVSGSLSVSGSIFATDKSFEIPHPTQEGKRLVYGVLEGPEHAAYCRGKSSEGIIDLPEEWTGLIDEESITVQLTSIGASSVLHVQEIKDNKVYVSNDSEYFYLVHGTRKDIDKLQTVREV
jgi:hypothetical protein